MDLSFYNNIIKKYITKNKNGKIPLFIKKTDSDTIRSNMIIVYTSGVFDILHRGHINILVKAKELGDKLVVGIQEDRAVFESKAQMPALSTEERVAQMRALPFVDEVITYSSGIDPSDALARVKPNIMVQGDDWPQQMDRAKIINYLNAHNIQLVLVPYTKEISDTEIKRRIKAA